MSINLSAERAKKEPPRDRYGRYLLRLPGDAKPRGRTRVTTFIKSLDQGDGLIAWKATANMVGALRTPGLHAKWAALFAETADPWYHSEETKARCKKLVDECADHGGASSRADLGTALHSMLERVARGEKVNLVDPYRADVEAWIATLAAAGITPDPQWCEVVVYIERYDLVGTFDGLVRQAGRDLAIISDNKTETSTDYKALSHACQLAAYSLATHAVVFPDDPNDVAELVPLPERDLDTGLIIHLPAGEARCALHAVDLEQGRQALEVAAAIRRLDAQRKRKDTGGLMRAWAKDAPLPASSREAKEEVAPEQHSSRLAEGYKARLLIDRRADLTRDLKARPEFVKAFNEVRLAAGLPKISEAGDVEVIALGDILTELVRQAQRTPVEQPENPFDGLELSSKAASVFTPPDEGRRMDDADVEHLIKMLEGLDGKGAAFVAQVGKEAKDAGTPVLLLRHKTLRRYEITRAALRCARLIGSGEYNADAIRELIGMVTREELQPAFTIGAAFAALTIEQASLLVELADAMSEGKHIRYDAAGMPVVVAA